MSRAEKDRRYRLKNEDKRKAYQAQWRLENAEHLKQRAARRRLLKRAMCLVAAARVRARRKSIEFMLGDADIELLQAAIDRGICEVSGVALTLTGPRSATSPSLDRIKPELGYVAGNIRIVCHALNAGMGDWGEDELLRIVEAWTAMRSSRQPQRPSSARTSK